tara:strand:- start:312 stop:938 length:627 start_codon:yes stop_codon:yes gene_type:complete
MSDPIIQPLFSKVFYVNNLELDYKKIIPLIDKDFSDTGYHNDEDIKNPGQSSISKKVLERPKLKFLKKQLMKELHLYTKDVLKYDNEFKMTTSWFTRTYSNQESNYHCHSNCMISSVLYIQVDNSSGDISFMDYSTERFCLDPREYNIYNSRSWRFKPVNGMVIFFPSEVFHKVLQSNSNIVRYSLACNYIPTGDLSMKSSDSHLYLK